MKSFCGHAVHHIDGLPTVIESVKGFTAKGYTINTDLTTTKTYVVRVGNSFAHGETVKDAREDAEAKHLQQSPVEERIALFQETFSASSSIPAKDLFDWHFKLTGSCQFGRTRFVEERGINLERDSFTVQEFIDLTKNSYGGDVIAELEKSYTCHS